MVDLTGRGPDGTPATGDFIEGSLSGCFVPNIVYATVIAYNTDKFPEGKQPRSWADFWNVEEFPGPRSLYPRSGRVRPPAG